MKKILSILLFLPFSIFSQNHIYNEKIETDVVVKKVIDYVQKNKK